MSTAPRARRPAFGRSLLRLFTVQGSWNYERMQGVGMGVAEEPLLRDLRVAGNGAAYRAAVARGAHFFNAHPYLCGLAVGAAARAEHEGVPPEQVERLRDHHLGHAHQIEADQGTPGEQPQEELQAHVKSSRGTGAAVGTSCAVTTMPRAASALSCAASASLK